MRKRGNKHLEYKADNKWISVIGFIFSVALLSIAIVFSINQEKVDKLASSKDYTMTNMTLTASSEISKSINEVAETNEISSGPIIVPSEEKNNKEIEKETKDSVSDKTNGLNETKIANESEIKIEEKKEEITDEVNKQFVKPVNGDLYKEFSMDRLVYSDTLQEWVTHRGVDYQVNISDDVKASAKGTIKSIKNDPRYGWSITIEHDDGFSTVYTCLVDASLVKEGDYVEQGQVIAKAGNSGVFESADGSHLHFEMMKDGDYINPEMYIK